ncbi:hypothetical protein SAMN05421770_1144 [Granulicella rosea]|uniref:Endo-1,3-beta-glucanase btgC n=1 Tax=Granulicella rosea TaxID=474952 RepID=A0A239MIV0_9BACT|nr:hypothetical protein [Granulicella rosea]SNT42591.1 hypothetical protein SAMN05421770_1144 [Granulicella rosea]
MRHDRRVAALGVAALLALAALLGVSGCRRQPKLAPASTDFRGYIADPSARMIAYSPVGAVLQDPSHRVLRDQLALLRTRFDGLSLYQTTSDTAALVAIARELGFRAVLFTIWDPKAEPELATISSILAQQHGAMAFAVSIGSEGLSEKRYALSDLGAARLQLRERTRGAKPVEMTTTEPWWFYGTPEGRPAASFGEFTSANVHVVWDTDIVDPALAASWTRDRANELKASVGHPVLIRELGMPGGGTSPRPLGPRHDRELLFSRELQAQFWSAWQGLPGRPPAVVFEAIDNPEKHWRDFESTWGLLDESLRPWPGWAVFPVLERARP